MRKTHGKEATCLFSTVTAWFIQSFWGFISHAQGLLAWAIPCLHAKPHPDFQRMNLRQFGASSYLLHTQFLQCQQQIFSPSHKTSLDMRGECGLSQM